MTKINLTKNRLRRNIKATEIKRFTVIWKILFTFFIETKIFLNGKKRSIFPKFGIFLVFTRLSLDIGSTCMMVRPSVRLIEVTGPSEEFTHTSTYLTLSFANNNTFIQWIVWNWFTDFFQNLKKCSKFQKFILKSCIWNFLSKSQKMFKISNKYVKKLYLIFFKISENVQNFKNLC